MRVGGPKKKKPGAGTKNLGPRVSRAGYFLSQQSRLAGGFGLGQTRGLCTGNEYLSATGASSVRNVASRTTQLPCCDAPLGMPASYHSSVIFPGASSAQRKPSHVVRRDRCSASPCVSRQRRRFNKQPLHPHCKVNSQILSHLISLFPSLLPIYAFMVEELKAGIDFATSTSTDKRTPHMR